MNRPIRGYLAVKLTALDDHGLRSAYWPVYEAVASTLSSVDGFVLHAPHRLTDPNAPAPDHLTPRDVYLLDRLHVTHADLVVACIELPSFGVGAELQLASDHGIPIVPFYYAQAGREPSRLILGMPGVGPPAGSGGTRLLRYTPNAPGEAELLARLLAMVRLLVAERAAPPAATRRGIAVALERRRRAIELAPAQLARKAGVVPECAELLTLAGEGFAAWLAKPHVKARTSVDVASIDEDLVLLPALDAVLRMLVALEVPAIDVAALLGLA